MNNPYYNAFDRKHHPLVPSKEEYDFYKPPMIIDKKTNLLRQKTIKEMTVKELTYYNYIQNYNIVKKV